MLHGGLSQELDNQAFLQLITLDHGARDTMGLSLQQERGLRSWSVEGQKEPRPGNRHRGWHRIPNVRGTVGGWRFGPTAHPAASTAGRGLHRRLPCPCLGWCHRPAFSPDSRGPRPRPPGLPP